MVDTVVGSSDSTAEEGVRDKAEQLLKNVIARAPLGAGLERFDPTDILGNPTLITVSDNHGISLNLKVGDTGDLQVEFCLLIPNGDLTANFHIGKIIWKFRVVHLETEDGQRYAGMLMAGVEATSNYRKMLLRPDMVEIMKFVNNELAGSPATFFQGLLDNIQEPANIPPRHHRKAQPVALIHHMANLLQ